MRQNRVCYGGHAWIWYGLAETEIWEMASEREEAGGCEDEDEVKEIINSSRMEAR